MRQRLIIVVLFSALVACAYFLFRTQGELALAREKLKASLEDAVRVESEAAAAAQRFSESELKRLREVEREAIRLRGAVGDLKNSLASTEKDRDAARRAAATADRSKGAATGSTGEGEAVNPYTVVRKQKANAIVPSGTALVLGDFGAGVDKEKRLFAVTIPKLMANNSGAVEIETKWIEISGTNVDFAGLGLRHLNLFTPDEFKELEDYLKQMAGVDFLSPPRISTGSGIPASISITEKRDTPAGAADFGPAIDLVATISPGGDSINLAVNASLTESKPQNDDGAADQE